VEERLARIGEDHVESDRAFGSCGVSEKGSDALAVGNPLQDLVAEGGERKLRDLSGRDRLAVAYRREPVIPGHHFTSR
jgi:hypothetical protein